MDRTNKNPGAAATASGVKQISPIRNLVQCIRIAHVSQPNAVAILVVSPRIQPHHYKTAHDLLSPVASKSGEARHD
jgi:hypothetical protein